jgi:hypothetical protein
MPMRIVIEPTNQIVDLEESNHGMASVWHGVTVDDGVRVHVFVTMIDVDEPDQVPTMAQRMAEMPDTLPVIPLHALRKTRQHPQG